MNFFHWHSWNREFGVLNDESESESAEDYTKHLIGQINRIIFTVIRYGKPPRKAKALMMYGSTIVTIWVHHRK
jgi:hypothetical protein